MKKMKCEVCLKKGFNKLHMVSISGPLTASQMKDHWTCEREIKVCGKCKDLINFRTFASRFKDEW